MDSGSRSLRVAELDGLLVCPGDLILDGVRIAVVTDNDGGILLREALTDNGPALEIVILS
jgi:hypothetical protein